MIKVNSVAGSFVINQGVLTSEVPEFQKLFKLIDQVVLPSQGDPDFVLANRMIEALSDGQIEAYIPDQSETDRIY